MENAKTIRDLINVTQLTDNDYLPVNQSVFNPLTGNNGDTRKATIKQISDYMVATGLNEAIGSLEEVETLSDNNVLPIKQQNITRKATVKQITDHVITRTYTEVMFQAIPFLTALSRQQLQIRDGTIFKITVSGADRFFKANGNVILDISTILDTGIIANGKDYYLFIVPDNDTVKILLSLTKTAPTGYSTASVKLIGGFHTLCANAGNGMVYTMGDQSLSHPLNGYLAGDILPASVWCLNHRPYCEPEGMVYISSLDFWCDIYLQSGSGVNTKSIYQATPTRSRQYVDHVEDMICVKKELLDDAEFAAAMMGSNEQTNIGGSAFPGNGAGGHIDTAGRRMISIYGVEEGCGLLWQWLRTTSAAGVDGSIYGQTATTPTYGWISMTQSSYGPYGQAGGKGSFWGLAAVVLAGCGWSDSASCGSRSRHAANMRSRTHARFGGRGRSRNIHTFQ
ncbi:MAG: hypothetical protein LBB81_01280 [Treponema sp.]|jgi:hypothetical protein|nr:hypothetical protein [Treponema sp.]